MAALRYPLPYSFARTSQLLLEDDGTDLTLWHAGGPTGSAWGEIMRRYHVRAVQQVDMGTLAQRISAAYSQGESSAATVVSEVQNEADLSRIMQELPAVEDLLETSDDAPKIRTLTEPSLAVVRGLEWYSPMFPNSRRRCSSRFRMPAFLHK